MLLDIALRLRPDLRSPAEARKSLEALRVSFDDPVVDDAALLLSEVVTNSVRHAGLDVTESIEVRIRGSRSMLHVDVIDPGPGFETTGLSPPERDGGWGLWLLDRLATRWGVEQEDKTRVWFDLARVPPTPPRVGEKGERIRRVRRYPVGEKTDKAKGHAKEAVGDLTDDERLEREGKLDRMRGEMKGRAEDVKDTVGEGVDAVRDRMGDEA